MMTSLKYCWIVFLFCCAVSAIAADTVTGTVHNMTKGQPAVGDEVVLLRLAGTMPEEGRAKTDANGAFTLKVSPSQDQYLLRVIHQGVNYDQPASSASRMQIAVYDAVPRVAGLVGSIGIAQLQSDGKFLTVTEMYDINNNSDPPVTQSRPDNFALSLPAQAVFDDVEVRRKQGIWLRVKPEPVKGEAGKYAIDFPIRPGETLYKITYHVPYHGPMTLHLKLAYPIQRFAVMLPSSMQFKPLQANTFQADQGQGLVAEAVKASPVAGEVPGFEISGTGSAPEHGTEAAAPPPAAAPVNPEAQAAAAPAHPAPSPRNQKTKELWLMIFGMVTIVAVLVVALWRTRERPVSLPAVKRSGNMDSVEALKEELFQLESERAGGSISAEEYAASKKALTETLERVLAKKGQ
jgi:hypothetical protein